MKILITGGAGFVGSHLAFAFREQFPSAKITAFDNLHRRGSEGNLQALQHSGIDFFHGDVRHPGDFDDLPNDYDLFIEASAEPSVLAGLGGSPRYVIDTNLVGTLNALEFARKRAGTFLFLSTSRVYSTEPLTKLHLRESDTRFELEADQDSPGASPLGISEEFPTQLSRSFYGASKLASELFIQEYAEHYRLNAIINRCGVIAGPGQFGKVDQGVFTLWIARHYFNKPLEYRGFGGQGKQVRDLLHPQDLFDLIVKQHESSAKHTGDSFNVGGGMKVSTSLAEWTQAARETTGMKVPVVGNPDTHAVDVPFYVSDHSKVSQAFAWEPQRDAKTIAQDICTWIRSREKDLRVFFGG
jgi:CDP-paratose 2-epimerase